MRRSVARSLATLVVAACCLTTAIACASSGGRGGGPVTQARNPNQMDSTQFRRPEFRTIYDAIDGLHPEWLRVQGGPPRVSAGQSPVLGVFVEGDSRGYGFEKLRELLVEEVGSVRRISSPESIGTYGPQWAWGGIVVMRAR